MGGYVVGRVGANYSVDLAQINTCVSDSGDKDTRFRLPLLPLPDFDSLVSEIGQTEAKEFFQHVYCIISRSPNAANAVEWCSHIPWVDLRRYYSLQVIAHSAEFNAHLLARQSRNFEEAEETKEKAQLVTDTMIKYMKVQQNAKARDRLFVLRECVSPN